VSQYESNRLVYIMKVNGELWVNLRTLPLKLRLHHFAHLYVSFVLLVVVTITSMIISMFIFACCGVSVCGHFFQ
jgi:hypothetical protein